MNSTYDVSNVFAKILRSDLPCQKVYEDTWCLAFYDRAPKASTHVLVIPKGPYVTFDDFLKKATNEEIIGFHKGILSVIETLKLTHYKLASHNGVESGQEVPHYHVHILSSQRVV